MYQVILSPTRFLARPLTLDFHARAGWAMKGNDEHLIFSLRVVSTLYPSLVVGYIE